MFDSIKTYIYRLLNSCRNTSDYGCYNRIAGRTAYFDCKNNKRMYRITNSKRRDRMFTGRNLDNLFRDEQSSNLIQDKLKSIQLEFTNIKLNTPIKITERMEWEHLHTRLFQAEMDICSKFQILQSILENDESKDHRDIEVKRLQKGMLDSNNGILNNLSVIHQELVGPTLIHPKQGLLEMWYKGACNNMIEHPMCAKKCYHTITKHLTKAAILQFKGFFLFNGANANSQFCSTHLKSFENNLLIQSNKMDATISKHMKYFADLNKKIVFYLRPVSGVRFEPFVKRKGPQKELFYEYNLENKGEEKWIFEKSSMFDKDGSLIISGNFEENDEKHCFLSVDDEHKAISVSKEDVQPFFCNAD